MNDKLKHFIAGFVICIIGYVVIGLFTSVIQASLAGLFLAFLAGLLKELYDKFIKKTCFDWGDWAMTNIGGIIGFIVIEVIKCW